MKIKDKPQPSEIPRVEFVVQATRREADRLLIELREVDAADFRSALRVIARVLGEEVAKLAVDRVMAVELVERPARPRWRLLE